MANSANLKDQHSSRSPFKAAQQLRRHTSHDQAGRNIRNNRSTRTHDRLSPDRDTLFHASADPDHREPPDLYRAR
jgi:hypothetical protein